MSGFLSSFKKAGGDGLKSSSASESVNMRFTIQPTAGESGFSQWVAAMKMVAQLPGGIPSEFRRRLWITMAERHLASRGVDWSQVEKSCFSEWSHPADAELGIQIVKDLHRTGCSLFCGEDGQENQALLKKVLLAYARWNKAVGYCQGFNMLAALILQVTDRCESDALKLMIYLIEGVLPDSYFADSLRGLSVDMAVFRELLRSKLPRLSKHLDVLQNAAKDGSRSYEPPLTNVFTMQWFLTLFCNCLPQPTVLRVWDLIFLEGNEILLRTALAIWQVLAQRILVVRTADEFYCVMGALTRELLESNLIDANTLIKAIVTIGPLTELKNLRDHYLYNITPWGTSLPQAANKQISLHPKPSIPLDISALKKQYVKLKQRQRQAHIIFSSAISRQPQPVAPVAMNHLLVGKRALGPSKRLGPPKGSIPPARQIHPSTLHWKDAEKPASSSSSSDTELCDDDVQSSSDEEDKPSKPSQITDNLNVSDTNLMQNDNTVSANKTSESDTNAASLAMPTDDSNPISDRLSPTLINPKLASDSEDESAEFESFLADRVKCFKSADADSSVDVSISTRRNSELALQIIQENSLILHRIMQCQSRFSPSPPLSSQNASESHQSDTANNFSYLFEQSDVETKLQKMENVCSWIDSQSNYSEVDGGSEKQYESRYHSILEKSKSLDERYHNLFSSSSKEKLPPILVGLHESKSESPVGNKAEDIFNSPSTNFSDIDFFESMIPKRDSEDTLVLQSVSDDGAKDKISSKLIQENLDLLKACSASKQQKRSHLSKKLIQENVDLLESITSEKSIQIIESKVDDVDAVSPAFARMDYNESAATSANTSDKDFENAKTDFENLSDFLMISNTENKSVDNQKIEDKDSAISMMDESSASKTSVVHCLVNLDNDSSELTCKDSTDAAAAAEQIKDKIDHSCDKSSDASETKPSFNLKLVSPNSLSVKSPSPNSTLRVSPTFSRRIFLEQPTKTSDCDEPVNLNKSPSHVFNPFPVALNSRQNKEVPLKLGLYKK